MSHLRDESYVNDDITKATSMELVNTMKDLLNMNPLYGEQFRTLMSLTGAGAGGRAGPGSGELLNPSGAEKRGGTGRATHERHPWG